MENEAEQTNPNPNKKIPVFKGTQVPIETLFDYIEAGDELDDFLHDYPAVSREVATRVLQLGH